MNGFNQGPMRGNGFSGLTPNPNIGMNGINTFPHYEIIQVNGKNGAEMFQMGPNSKALLLDANNPIVWLVQTDGAGYKSIDPYKITPYQPAPSIDIENLNDRLTALEEKVNAKSYSGTGKQPRKSNRNEQQSNGYVETSDTTV